MNPALSKAGYLKVWVALMVLLGLTWTIARFDLGTANTVLALAIAVLKMLLVMLFFMHVRFHGKMVWLFAAAGFLWLTFMLALTMTDYLTRTTVVPYDKEIQPQMRQAATPS